MYINTLTKNVNYKGTSRENIIGVKVTVF